MPLLLSTLLPPTTPLLSWPRSSLSLTPTPTVLPMTTPRLTSTLLRPLMPTVLSVAPTPSPSPTAESRPSPTPPTTPTATSLRFPTLERLSTPLPPPVVTLVRLRPTLPLHMLHLSTTHLPLHTTPKPSLCSVNI